MKQRSVAIMGSIGVIVVVAVMFATQRRGLAAAQSQVSLQTPVESLGQKKEISVLAAAPSKISPVAQLAYSKAEYQFLRQHYKSPNPQADGPLFGFHLKLLATVTKNNMVYNRHLWPVVREVLYGNTSALENRLDAGLSPDSWVIIGYPYNSRVTLLDFAVEAGQRSCIKALLAHDANVNPKSVNLSEVPLNAKPIQFAGPLALAADYGEDDVIRILLQRGASVNQSIGMGDGNNSALAEAVYGGGPATAYLLLTHGADINSILGPGGSLPGAFEQQYMNPSMIAMRNLLIKFGAKASSSQ